MSGAELFSLYLLSRMRGAAMVAAALESRALTADAMREAARHVGRDLGLDDIGHRLGAYVGLLGPPMDAVPEPGIGPDEAFGGSMRHTFHLPLWPGMDFIVRTHREGYAWGPELVRRAGVVPPLPDRPEDLQPWTVLDSEVRGRFGRFAVEEAWNHGKDAEYHVGRAGGRMTVVLVFDFALLQSVSVLL